MISSVRSNGSKYLGPSANRGGRRTRRLRLSSSLVVVGAIALTQPAYAYGASRSPSQSVHKVVLTMTEWDNGATEATVESGLRIFERENPGITVNYQYIPYSSYETKVLTELASGTGPDVLLVPDTDFGVFADSGRLENLSPLYHKHLYGLNVNNFIPSLVRASTVNGKLFYVIKDWAPDVMYYNKTLFRKANVPYPSSGWTWQGFLRDAKKLTITHNGTTTQWGVELQGTEARDGVEYFSEDWGGNIINTKGQPTLLNSKAVAGISFYLQMYRDGVAPSPAAVTGFGSIDLFNTQRVAMDMYGPWNVPSWLSNKKLSFGAVQLPVGPAGQQAPLFTAGYAVNSASPNITAAEKLVAFFGTAAWERLDDRDAQVALKAFEPIAVHQVPYMRVLYNEAPYLQPLDPARSANWAKYYQPPLTDLVNSAVEHRSVSIVGLLRTAQNEIVKNIKYDESLG